MVYGVFGTGGIIGQGKFLFIFIVKLVILVNGIRGKKMNGKRKGSEFERKISKELSLWLTDNESADCVWRTSNSGGKATVTESTFQTGDIMPIGDNKTVHGFFKHYSLELKNYKDLDLLDVQNKTFKLPDWWEQSKKDAQKGNKIPIVIFKINRKGTWIVYDESIPFRFIEEKNPPEVLLKIKNNKVTLCIEPFYLFLDRVEIKERMAN
jgi:hypothetical protein